MNLLKAVTLLIFSSFLSVTALLYDEVTCSGNGILQTHSVPLNTLTYFRTQDFPKNLHHGNSTNSSVACHEHFVAVGEKTRLWAIIYNGQLGKTKMVNGRGFSEHVEIRSWASHDQYLPWNTKSEILLFKSHFSHDWTAFEGAVLAYNVSLLNSCPFENETIYIEEGKIVPITTTYDLYGPPKNCTFIFSINKETQLLKIVVRTVYVEKNQYYETTHGKGMQKMYNIKFRETPPSVAYLKSNNNGIVTFHLPVGHFLALASVVKKDVTYAKNECKTTLNGNVTNVFNLDYEIGYAPYEICEYIITVENDSEVLLKPDKLYIEQHADELLLEESSGNKTYINNLHQVFMLSKDASQTVIRFKSDGNIQQPGFILHLKTVECKCGESNIIVPCEGKMTILPAINSEYYCSNMQCNYTISMEQSCDRTYFKLDIHARLNGNDRLKLFVKDTFKESIFTNGARTFLSNARISLTFVSQNSKAVRPAGHWKIYAFTTEPPWSKKTWFLNSTSSAQAFWLDDLSEKREYTICGTNDEVLEMFVAGKTSLLSYYNLFDSNKMDNFVSSFNSSFTTIDSFIRYGASSSGCFTIYKHKHIEKVYTTVLFRLRNAQTKYCGTFFNIVSLTFKYSEIKMESNTIGKCEAYFFTNTENFPKITLSNFNVSPDSKLIFKNGISKKEYFYLNSSTINQWNIVHLSAPLLSTDVLPSDILSFNVTRKNQYHLIEIDKIGKGIVASSSYGEISEKEKQLFVLKADKKYKIYFVLKYIDEKEMLILQNLSSDKNVTLTTNSGVTEVGEIFQIHYKENTDFSTGFLLEYTVEEKVEEESIDKVYVSKVNITITEKYFVYWLNELNVNELISVCSDGHRQLDLYISHSALPLSDYELYDSNDVKNFVTTLDSPNITSTLPSVPRRITSNNTCFTVLRKSGNKNPFATLLFKIRNSPYMFCRDNNNVFQTMDVRFFDSPPPISSPFNEKCEMIILASQTDLPIISIASLDYYKDSLSYFTFKSAVNEKVLFEASFADAKFWKNIVIYTHALLIQYSGQIKIQLGYEKVINHNGDVQKGIMASPSYTGFPIALKDPFLLYQISSTNSVAASLTVKSASPGSIATLVLNNENTNISLTNNLKTTQVSKTFDLYFSETEAKNGGFLIQYTLQPGNKSTVVKLTTSKPTFVYHLDDMKHYDILTVCSSNNQTLELFTSTNLMTLSGYKLYDSNTLSNIVKRWTTDTVKKSENNIPPSIEAKSGCFTLTNKEKESGNNTFTTLLFRMKEVHIKTCATQNIFKSPFFTAALKNATIIFAQATYIGKCELIILSSFMNSIYIKSLKTSTLENYQLKSAVNNKHLANISGTTDYLWKEIYIYSSSLSIIIPPSGSVAVEFGSLLKDPYEIKKVVNGQKGIITSPSYTGTNQTCFGLSKLYKFDNTKCSSDKCEINFEVKSLFYDDKVVIHDHKKDLNYTLFKHDNVTINSTLVSIYHLCFKTTEQQGFLIEYNFIGSGVSQNVPKFFVVSFGIIFLCCLI